MQAQVESLPFALRHSVTGLGMGHHFCQTKLFPVLVAMTTLFREITLILTFSCTASRVSSALVNALIFNSVFCIFKMTE